MRPILFPQWIVFLFLAAVHRDAENLAAHRLEHRQRLCEKAIRSIQEVAFFGPNHRDVEWLQPSNAVLLRLFW
jgi:hypothetical protein